MTVPAGSESRMAGRAARQVPDGIAAVALCTLARPESLRLCGPASTGIQPGLWPDGTGADTGLAELWTSNGQPDQQ